jgi:hypothetical protein
MRIPAGSGPHALGATSIRMDGGPAACSATSRSLQEALRQGLQRTCNTNPCQRSNHRPYICASQPLCAGANDGRRAAPEHSLQSIAFDFKVFLLTFHPLLLLHVRTHARAGARARTHTHVISACYACPCVSIASCKHAHASRA